MLRCVRKSISISRLIYCAHVERRCVNDTSDGILYYLFIFIFYVTYFINDLQKKMIRIIKKQSSSPEKTFVIVYYNIITLGEYILTVDQRSSTVYRTRQRRIKEASSVKMGFLPPKDKISARNGTKSNSFRNENIVRKKCIYIE